MTLDELCTVSTTFRNTGWIALSTRKFQRPVKPEAPLIRSCCVCVVQSKLNSPPLLPVTTVTASRIQYNASDTKLGTMQDAMPSRGGGGVWTGGAWRAIAANANPLLMMGSQALASWPLFRSRPFPCSRCMHAVAVGDGCTVHVRSYVYSVHPRICCASATTATYDPWFPQIHVHGPLASEDAGETS